MCGACDFTGVHKFTIAKPVICCPVNISGSVNVSVDKYKR